MNAFAVLAAVVVVVLAPIYILQILYLRRKYQNWRKDND